MLSGFFHAPRRWIDDYIATLRATEAEKKRLGGQCRCGAAAMSDDYLCSECRAEESAAP